MRRLAESWKSEILPAPRRVKKQNEKEDVAIYNGALPSGLVLGAHALGAAVGPPGGVRN